MNNGRNRRPAGKFGLILCSLATVLMLAVAMPGHFGWWPFLFVALVPLLLVISRYSPRQSAMAGLLTGFLYHVSLLYWIVIVLGRYGGLPVWLSVPALLLLSLYMGLYTALFAGLLGLVVQRGRKSAGIQASILILGPLLWVGLEWLRGTLFSGFPWMDLGYGLYAHPLLIQAADLGGHHLVTFALVMINGLIFCGMAASCKKERLQGRGGIAVTTAVVVILLFGCYSLVRYQQFGNELAASPVTRIAVVQGDIPQDQKWTPDQRLSTFEKYRRLSLTTLGQDHPALLVWPETALPFYPDNDPLFGEVTGLARDQQVWLLTGAPHFSIISRQTVEYYNSAFLVSPQGVVRGRYDKRHLVPFGEYVPLRRFLPFLAPLVETVGNFIPGRTGGPLAADGIKIGTLICYESIFPGLARSSVARGANLLVNLTNDAWYGRSSAPYQSFAMTVFRAVENRRSLVRAANTGISGFVTPLGRITRQSPIFEPLALSAEVPLYTGTTFFGHAGYFFGPACLAVFFLVTVPWKKSTS